MGLNSGYLQKEADVSDAMNRLTVYINKLPEYFKNLSSGELLSKPAPGKWSKKEILGHLVDSAINNLKRFTEIQFLPQPYKIISYRQAELVAVNDYQHLELDHIINLWKFLNRQIIFVVENISQEKLIYPVDPQYDINEIKTLGWIICDYVAHMEHHMKQINENYVFM
jgi:hypothetical protein